MASNTARVQGLVDMVRGWEQTDLVEALEELMQHDEQVAEWIEQMLNRQPGVPSSLSPRK